MVSADARSLRRNGTLALSVATNTSLNIRTHNATKKNNPSPDKIIHIPMEELKEQYDVGEEVVVLSRYSNDPEFVGEVIGFSEDIVELKVRRGLFTKKCLVPRKQVQRIKRYKNTRTGEIGIIVSVIPEGGVSKISESTMIVNDKLLPLEIENLDILEEVPAPLELRDGIIV